MIDQMRRTVRHASGDVDGDGYECNVTNTESTLFEGTVGDIPQSAYDSTKAQSFGLFAYPFTHGDQQFTVVNYWVK